MQNSLRFSIRMKNVFHISGPHETDQQYIRNHSITFNSCPIDPKFAYFEAISILNIMFTQDRNQGLAAAFPTFQRFQKIDDSQLKKQYDDFKCVNIGSIEHELKVSENILLVCLCFKYMK